MAPRQYADMQRAGRPQPPPHTYCRTADPPNPPELPLLALQSCFALGRIAPPKATTPAPRRAWLHAHYPIPK